MRIARRSLIACSSPGIYISKRNHKKKCAAFKFMAKSYTKYGHVNAFGCICMLKVNYERFIDKPIDKLIDVAQQAQFDSQQLLFGYIIHTWNCMY